MRVARRRFGRFEVLDFVAVLFGYAFSGERTLQAFHERLRPWASARTRGHQQGCFRSTGERTGWGARLEKQMQAAEARLRQAEQNTPLSQSSPPESAKQQEEQASDEGAAEAGERQAQLRTIASDLLYWRQGLKVLKQARLPKWRGSFKWQIEAKVEALQTEFARLRAEAAKPDD